MAKKILFCPRCMNRVHKGDEKCTNCGLSRDEMEEMLTKKPKEEKVEESAKPIVKNEDGGISIDTQAIINDQSILSEENKDNEEAEKASEEASEEQVEEPSEQVSYEKGIDSNEIGKVVFEESKAKRHKHKKKKQEELPEYSVDENGEYNINTKDVTFLEGVEAPTYSVKKARGDYKQEKLKWWEIYKWADRHLAKRKIMKEVNKASRKTPYGISRGVMITLCLLFGYMGAHSLYAKNYGRGLTSLISFIIAVIVISVEPLYRIMGVFVGGGLGFLVMAMWVVDLLALIMNRYKYRISKEEFISNLNVETRAKISNKYIDFDRTVFKAKEEKRKEKILRKKNKHRKKYE